jgi:hypothetical protein
MTGDESDVQVRWVSRNSAATALVLVLWGCLLSTAAGAAGPSGRTHGPELRALLASDNALSEAAMARQTATGLQSPPVIANDQGGGARVQLWDELRIRGSIAPITNPVTVGGNASK